MAKSATVTKGTTSVVTQPKSLLALIANPPPVKAGKKSKAPAENVEVMNLALESLVAVGDLKQQANSLGFTVMGKLPNGRAVGGRLWISTKS